MFWLTKRKHSIPWAGAYRIHALPLHLCEQFGYWQARDKTRVLNALTQAGSARSTQSAAPNSLERWIRRADVALPSALANALFRWPCFPMPEVLLEVILCVPDHPRLSLLAQRALCALFMCHLL